MSLASDKDCLEMNYCVILKTYTVKDGHHGISFQLNGRSYDMKRLADHQVYLKRLDKQFKTINDMLQYITSYNEVKGLNPLKNKSIRASANQCRLTHIDWWIDQYKEYLSINELNNSEGQIKAFYNWWYNISGYTSTPKHDLEKKS